MVTDNRSASVEISRSMVRLAVLPLLAAALLVPHAKAAQSDADASVQEKAKPVIPANMPVEKATRPPKDLKFVKDHWTPYDPPTLPDGVQGQVITPGDTLWGLSGKLLGNVWLWPQLWERNRYILDSHWIYPGDPIVVPEAPTVVAGNTEATPAAGNLDEAADNEGVYEAAPPAKVGVPAAPRPHELADITDLRCSSYIDEGWQEPAAMIAGLSERSRLVSAIGDIVYINQGSNDGVKLGTEFDVVRAIGRVKSPSTHDVLGTHVSQLGRVRVVAVEPQTATVEIVASCLDIHPNDRLVAAHDPEPILGFNPGPPARHGAAPSGKASGEVVVSPNLLHSVGQGHIVQIDLGEGEGVQRGTRVSLFSSNDAGSSYERNMLGSGVVITVHGNTSAVKILDSYREIYIGDRVELQ